MNTSPPAVRTKGKSKVFGIFVVQHDRDRRTYKLRINYPRLVLAGVLLLFLAYAGIIGAGYLWLHQVRKVEQVSLWDVAFFRAGRVREKMGRDQFAAGGTLWKDGKFQPAFLAFSTGLRNAPDFLQGRLEAVDFMLAAGQSSLAISALEDGLQRHPESEVLLTRTLDLLTATGRDEEALKLIHGILASEAAGSRAALIRTYEILAVFNTQGLAPALRLVELYPEVSKRALSGSVIGRLLWGSKRRLEAIAALQNYVEAAPSDYMGYALLAQYQEEAGMLSDAQATASLACEKIPDNYQPRILQIATSSPDNPANLPAWRKEISLYVSDFRSKPDAIGFLADLAGRKGWTPLARALYEASLSRQLGDPHVFAMYYSDALAHSGNPADALEVLMTLDRQVPDEGALAALLIQREIVTTFVLGRHEETRDDARKLIGILGRDPQRWELARRRFLQLGITDAVEEFAKSGAGTVASVVSKK